ncbi:hypothetical protein SDC9_145058 [bioreactor metagenome]|uniref:Uncharacterized protein n=1 Tax=bioreactor metagenome TaxID=1076179 RepID=A0A645E9R8_9ZZZZ
MAFFEHAGNRHRQFRQRGSHRDHGQRNHQRIDPPLLRRHHHGIDHEFRPRGNHHEAEKDQSDRAAPRHQHRLHRLFGRRRAVAAQQHGISGARRQQQYPAQTADSIHPRRQIRREIKPQRQRQADRQQNRHVPPERHPGKPDRAAQNQSRPENQCNIRNVAPDDIADDEGRFPGKSRVYARRQFRQRRPDADQGQADHQFRNPEAPRQTGRRVDEPVAALDQNRQSERKQNQIEPQHFNRKNHNSPRVSSIDSPCRQKERRARLSPVWVPFPSGPGVQSFWWA